MKDKLKKAMAILAVATGALFVAGSPALASAIPPVNADTTDTSTIAIAAPIVTLIVSLLIPVVNGYLTTAGTPSWVKGIGTIVLNAVSALIVGGLLADGTSAFSTETLYTTVLGCLVSFFMYANVYRPLNLTSTPQLQADGTVTEGKLASVGRT